MRDYDPDYLAVADGAIGAAPGGHGGHGGWYYDHGPDVRCACGTKVPSDVPGPGGDWYAEIREESGWEERP